MLRFFIITEKTLRFSYYLIFSFTFIKDAYSQPYKSLHFNRSVLLSGYHRILQYNITLPEVRGPTQILIMDTLPKDAYIDPYQLCKRIEDNEFKVTAKTSFHVPVGCAEDLCVVFVLTISVLVGTALYISSMLIKLNKKL
ncbi:hypothetical protein HNY73_017255 [Argiope bruennichi]|uniref:Phosphatidylinositol-glycan biosynthesis class X protein n=1 Tax=Argiope bruennichi TaxID=94029 RepID=A0A8T0EQ06_ARGBR|nr:hypothetical protein HNY73_017255 [Argiope bruennichi]